MGPRKTARAAAILAVSTAFLLPLSACSPSQPAAGTAVNGEIRFGLAPAEDSATVLTKFTPFIDYLGESTGMTIDPFVGADYTAVVAALNAGHLDAAWFGPSEYVLASQEVSGGVEAFASAVQDEGTVKYRTSFIVRTDSGIDGPEDFEGATVAFTDPASTSGHVFGRYSLLEAGYDPDAMFSQIIYSGSHDASLLSLINGQVEVAAISSRLLPGFIESGMADSDEITVVFESAEIPADPLVFRSDLPEEQKQKLRDSLLSGDKEIATSLSGTGFAGFTGVDDSSYDVVRNAYKAAGLEPKL